jgi:hypothetical protein
VLKPLKEATKRLKACGKQGKHSAIYKVIPIFEYILRAYKAIVKLYRDVDFNAYAKSLEDYLAINLQAA